MKELSWIVAVSLLVVASSVQPCCAQGKPAADLIILNAEVWTVDKALPNAHAVAVLGDRIVAVGGNTEMETWRGPHTRVIDANGKLLLPGFNDAHVHFVSGGMQLDNVDLKDAASPQEFARLIGERAKARPKSEWITGGNWDETKWNPPNIPSKELIDALTPETPLFVTRYDGHMGVANSVTLRLAGITAKTPDPPGGTIVRDKDGNPTGALKDAAAELVYKIIPPLNHDQRIKIIKRAMAHAASLGVTSVQHMGVDAEEVSAYAELLQRGELTVRIYAVTPIPEVEDLSKVGVRRAFGGPFLRLGGLKGFADGSLGSGTAYFYDPFLNQGENRGLLSDEMHPPSRMRDRMIKGDAAGLQLCTHAIGDHAISIILDFYSEIVKAHGEGDYRFRIEHAQHMAAKDFQRFADLHVIASVQPYHAIDDGRFAESRIGHDRASRTYAFRTFLDHGVRLALGTDWEVAPLDPMQTVYAAVTRATLDGKNPGGWFPEQKLSLAETIEAYTLGSAYAEFQENEKGSITPGRLADLVLLSDDLFTIAPEQIRNVHVLKTIVGGKVVFDAEAVSPAKHGAR
jgi:predicted amidohydrolase YtcJ